MRADGRIRTGTTSVAHWDATVEHHICSRERTTGFEPVRSGWKPDMLPLNITPAKTPSQWVSTESPGIEPGGPRWPSLASNQVVRPATRSPVVRTEGRGIEPRGPTQPSLASNQVVRLAAHPPGDGAEGDRTLLRLIDSQVATPVALDPVCISEKRRTEESNSQPLSCPRVRAGLGTIPRCPPCGTGRDRTDDLLSARQMLSQLSYSPEVDLAGIEPAIAAVRKRCPPN